MLIRLDPEHIHSPTRTQSLNCIPETQLMCTVIIACVGVCETDESAAGENYTHTHTYKCESVCVMGIDGIVTYYYHTYQCYRLNWVKDI